MTCYTALITPFNDKGELDERGFEENLARQTGVDGVVVAGSTGEAPTLTESEKKRLITLARNNTNHLMVGCGTYSTMQTLDNLKSASDLGADSALVVIPYYNKPTQEGIFQHFAYLAEKSPLPLIVYNIQGRTSVNLKSETLKRLLPFPMILGVKEGSGSLTQISEVISLKKIRSDFKVYASDDIWILPLMALGGDGVISTLSNLIPERIKELVTSDGMRARSIHHELTPLFEMVGIETNPIPIKAMMQLKGLAAGKPRLPLTPLDPSLIPGLQRCL